MRCHWIVLVAILMCAGLAGCYTMFSHPDVGVETAVHGDGRRCSDCHTGADYYANSYPYYYDSYWRHPRWWSYYCSPWWWYDWDNDDGGGGTQLPVGRSQYWDTRDRPSLDRPVVVPGSATGSGGGSATPSVNDDTKSTRAKSEDDRSDDSPKVRYWNRNTRPPRPPTQPEEKKPKTAEKKSEDEKTKERK